MANENRLIDANALMEVYRKVDYNSPGAWSLRDILSFLEIAPTVDAVEVVRCKDCKHLIVANKEDLYAYCPKMNTCFLPFQLDTREHFCSKGERKDNDG